MIGTVMSRHQKTREAGYGTAMRPSLSRPDGAAALAASMAPRFACAPWRDDPR